ncbi:hypothetical protein Tco_1106863 [Tanacetum coccineum]
MTILTLLMKIKSHSLSIKTPVKILHKVLHTLIIVVTGTCESCGKGAHYGYNFPSQVLIISKPEPCNNQTVNEFPQTLPSVHLTSCSGDENSFTYDSKPNFVDDSPNVFNPPPQPPMYSCEFCGNDARYGHYCTPQVPFIYPEPCYNQDFNFPQDFHDFQQQYLCCENCGGPHETFECQPLNYYEPNPCYDSNYSGYDQFDNFHPQQYLCCENYGGPHETYQCQPMNEDYYHEQNSCYDPNSFGFDQFLPQPLPVIDPTPLEKSMEELRIAFQAWSDNIRQKKEEEEKRIAEEQASKDRYWKIPICYDDDEDYTIAITPVLSTEEPVDSLIMEDEHLDTIPATESDEVIKSSVENLVPIPSESEGIPDSMCDVPLCNNPTRLEVFKEHSETIIDSNNDYSSSYDDSYENIDYVDASPPDAEIVNLEVVEIVIPEGGGIDTDIILTIKDDILHEKLLNVNLFIANIEALKDNPTPSSDNSSGSTTTRSDYSFSDYEAFYLDDDHVEEKSSGSTTTHADFSQYDSFIFDLSINQCPPADRSDCYHEEFAGELAHIISPLEYDCFYFKSEPDPGELTSIVDPVIRENVSSTTNVNLPFEDAQSPLLAYVVWIFLSFLMYPVAPPYLLSSGNEDTIFDPGISIYHSFMPGVSHRSGTFMKFNVYPNHLNESPMEILSSTCSSMDQ